MKVISLIETAKDTINGINERLQVLEPKSRKKKDNGSLSCAIKINLDAPKQTFNGFGGGLTEAAGYVLSKLPANVRAEAIQAYYGKDGIGYTGGRTHLNSCDFSLENWACVEKKDETLQSFSMKKPDLYITPLLADAKKACESDGKDFCLMVTPWSPPKWMKDNNDMNHGGHLKPEYKMLWAKYFVKFLQELKNRGIETNFVSVQNEPAAVQTWDSCIWSATEEAEFAVDFLRKELDTNGFKATKILVWDHNRDLLLKRITESMAYPGADQAIDGAAFHWYMGANYENLKKATALFPNKEFVFSEGSIEGGPRNGAWFSGERYAHNLINDLNNGCTRWFDWNIILDMQGGPNHVSNYCDAAILADTQKGVLNYQSSFYYIGHFSKFIKPKAVCLDCKIEGFMTPATVDGIMENYMECTSFINPDGSVVLVVCNRSEADMKFSVNFEGEKKSLIAKNDEFWCPPRAIQTFIINV